MKNFNELSHQELLNLTEQQIDAYIDVALAEAGQKRSTNVIIELPEYLKNIDELSAPERDIQLFEVDGKIFADLPTAAAYAEKVAEFSEKEVKVDYEWEIGSEYKFLNGLKSSYQKNSVNAIQVYSKEKFSQFKAKLKSIKEAKEKYSQNEEERVEDIIDYEKVEELQRQVLRKVRNAKLLEENAKNIAFNYDKYFSITGEKEKTIETLFTVYGAQDNFLRSLITDLLQDK